MKKWKLVKTTKTKDFSSFKAETGNNGGDYGFYYTSFLFQKTNDESKFLQITKTDSTADFNIADNGRFCGSNQMDWFYATDTVEKFEYTTDGNDDIFHVSLDKFPGAKEVWAQSVEEALERVRESDFVT